MSNITEGIYHDLKKNNYGVKEIKTIKTIGNIDKSSFERYTIDNIDSSYYTKFNVIK